MSDRPRCFSFCYQHGKPVYCELDEGHEGEET